LIPTKFFFFWILNNNYFKNIQKEYGLYCVYDNDLFIKKKIQTLIAKAVNSQNYERKLLWNFYYIDVKTEFKHVNDIEGFFHEKEIVNI